MWRGGRGSDVVMMSDVIHFFMIYPHVLKKLEWNGMEFFNFFHMKKIEMLFLLYHGWQLLKRHERTTMTMTTMTTMTATNYWTATAAATAIAAPDFKLTTQEQEQEQERHEECGGGCSAFHTLYGCDDDYEDGGVWFMCDACYINYTPQFNNHADAEVCDVWWWRRAQQYPYGLCVECGVGLEAETEFLVDQHDEHYETFTCDHCFQSRFGEAAFVEATTGQICGDTNPRRYTRVWATPGAVDEMCDLRCVI